MGAPEPIARIYRMADDAMTEFSTTYIGLFAGDKEDFVAFDSDFDDPFQELWQANITAAEEVVKDEVIVDEQTGLSAIVEKAMDASRHQFQSSKYFIEKAFLNNRPVHNEFGYDNYDDARQVQVRMISFMENFHRVAEKYKVKLLDANYTQEKIDEIEALRSQLHTANKNQEAFKKGRPVLTQDRITTLNKPWEEVLLVHKAAKNIYHDDTAKFGQYKLPATETPPGEEPPEEPPEG